MSENTNKVYSKPKFTFTNIVINPSRSGTVDQFSFDPPYLDNPNSLQLISKKVCVGALLYRLLVRAVFDDTNSWVDCIIAIEGAGKTKVSPAT